jgi:hypothetical protein
VGFFCFYAITGLPVIKESEVVISQIKTSLDQEYDLFTQSQSYQLYKNSEIPLKALFFSEALKSLKYPHSHLIPLGGGIYKFMNFNNFELDINLFDTPQFKNKTGFINWISETLHKNIYS